MNLDSNSDNEVNFRKNRNEEEKLIVGADLCCLACNTRTTKVYKPEITHIQFIYDKASLICPTCNEVLSSIPRFINANGNGDGIGADCENRKEENENGNEKGSSKLKTECEKKKDKSKDRPKGERKGKEDQKDEDKPKYYIQKFVSGLIVAESILIGDLPFFLVSNGGNITVREQLEFEDKIFKPLDQLSYVNKAYQFSSLLEVDAYLTKVVPDTLDSLYKKVKSTWKKYVDADDFHISICAADTIFTYFQDKIGLTHYLFFVGNNGSGKSNNLKVFQQLAYRNMTSTDVTAANIYQYLGSLEEGIGTLCEDEADNIDENREKMRIYKNGYTTGHPILRTDTTYGRKQYRFYTFCFKAFAAEKLPDSLKAKGFNQRIIEIPCFYGFPEYDISEVVNPAGEMEYQKLVYELEEVRNELLIYRLLHYHDRFEDIKVNLQNREKQLFKPLLRIFQKTQTWQELLPVVSKYVSQKRESNANSYHAFLYRCILELVKTKGSYTLDSLAIIEKITEDLGCNSIPGKPQTLLSQEFGELSHKGIIQTLKDVFGATKSRRHDQSRKLIFDGTKLEKLGRIYELAIDVQVIDGNENRADRADRTLSGRIPAITDYSDNMINDITKEEIYENSITKERISGELITGKFEKCPSLTGDVSDVSDVSDVAGTQPELKPETKSSLLTCQNCGEVLEPEPFYRRAHKCEKYVYSNPNISYAMQAFTSSVTRPTSMN